MLHYMAEVIEEQPFNQQWGFHFATEAGQHAVALLPLPEWLNCPHWCPVLEIYQRSADRRSLSTLCRTPSGCYSIRLQPSPHEGWDLCCTVTTVWSVLPSCTIYHCLWERFAVFKDFPPEIPGRIWKEANFTSLCRLCMCTGCLFASIHLFVCPSLVITLWLLLACFSLPISLFISLPWPFYICIFILFGRYSRGRKLISLSCFLFAALYLCVCPPNTCCCSKSQLSLLSDYQMLKKVLSTTIHTCV